MQPQSPYSMQDLLLLLGQCTVELAWLRGRVAELEAKLAAATPDNGTVPASEVERARAG